MLAGFQRHRRIFEMTFQIGENEDGVDSRIVAQRFGRGEVLATELGRPLFRSILPAIPEADEFRTGALPHGCGMEDGNVTGPEKADAESFFGEFGHVGNVMESLRNDFKGPRQIRRRSRFFLCGNRIDDKVTFFVTTFDLAVAIESRHSPNERIGMRGFLTAGLIVILGCGIAGCGSGNRARIEKNQDLVLAEMNQLVASFERGDKAAINAGFKKLAVLEKQVSSLKVSQSEKDALTMRIKNQLGNIQNRLTEVLKSAIASGKFTPEEMREFGEQFKNLRQ